MIENYKFTLSVLSIIVLSIIILNFDYFVTNEFEIESGFLVCINGLLIIYSLRLIGITKFNSFLSITIILLTLIISLYCLSILFILSFGYGFSGREVTKIWIAGFITNVGLLILVSLDIIHQFRIKQGGK